MMSRAVVIEDLDDGMFELRLRPPEIEAHAASSGNLHEALTRHALELFLIGQFLIGSRLRQGHLRRVWQRLGIALRDRKPLPALRVRHLAGMVEKARFALPVHPEAGIAVHHWPFMR